LGSATEVEGEGDCCIGVGVGWGTKMGVFGELYRSGNIAKNSCV